MERRMRTVDTFRVKIVAFRDYLTDDAAPMLVSNFFTLPQETDNLKRCLSSLVAEGGGDEAEDGFEALAYAIRSRWNTESGSRKRHIIVLWTDGDAHDLGYGKGSAYYPKGMAADIRELTAWWGDEDKPAYMDQGAKRLILFAPDTRNWRLISDNWDKAIHGPSVDFGELDDRILSSIFECIFEV